MPFTTTNASSLPMNVVVPRNLKMTRPSSARPKVRPGMRATMICSRDIPGDRAMSSAVITTPNVEGRRAELEPD
jgi:hypothetical protein